MKQCKVRIIKPDCRETGSTGTAFRESDDDMWFVNLDREQAPYRGNYEDSEVEILVEAARPERAGEGREE